MTTIKSTTNNRLQIYCHFWLALLSFFFDCIFYEYHWVWIILESNFCPSCSLFDERNKKYYKKFQLQLIALSRSLKWPSSPMVDWLYQSHILFSDGVSLLFRKIQQTIKCYNIITMVMALYHNRQPDFRSYAMVPNVCAWGLVDIPLAPL